MSNNPEIYFPYLGIEIQRLNKIAVTVFGIPIYWYGIIIGLGVVAGLLVALLEAKRRNQNSENYIDFLVYAIIFSVIGARLYYVIFSFENYKGDFLKIFNTREGGLAIYGAVIGAVLTAFVFTKKRKLDFLEFTDTGVLGLLAGQIIGRWANFVNREAFGRYTDSLFALRYLKHQVSDIPKSILDRVVIHNGMEYIQVTPTFLYESMWNLCVLIFLLFYRKKQKFTGEIFALYFLGYGCGRVWIEGLRTDQLILGNTSVPISQLLSAVLIISAIVFIYLKRRKLKTKNSYN